jgi:hypothetical protein
LTLKFSLEIGTLSITTLEMYSTVIFYQVHYIFQLLHIC